MNINRPSDISHFFVAGINYKKSDTAIRGQFAVNNDQYEAIIKSAPDHHIDSFFILSTCNRTEIYGFAEDASRLVNLICSQTKGDAATFADFAYIKKGADAVQHLYNVGAGLDSQILGDYEIVGQLKQAVKFSKDHNFINCFTERLFNSVLQSSKTIKNDTLLSGGTVSVSFAAVQYIKENITITPETKILLIGTGKIGRNTCKNLIDYLGTNNITLINRSDEKAQELASSLQLKFASIRDLESNIAAADIILTAANAVEPIILKSQFKHTSSKLIIDLAVPSNVEATVADLANVTLVNVDMLSKLKDETLNKRKAEAPKAKMIVAEHFADFMEWHQMRKNAPALNALKIKLSEISKQHQELLNGGETKCPFISFEQKIQRVVNGTASKMRSQNKGGCHYIEAINEFMILVAN
ncbi:glutamyl-tRNA reductase [Mucilaginibacter frigoritolerans]|uniref:Glutamyl-tRNA reductase n=1 Tax=Mucilaginibacter frigoritolerans TaxID=652788 RepID=A0A562TQR3_9SPHI|nr:glutamyl-tRNA reductase [Mucilaginibacter frigoritolerans]TWI95875.1 glutamyl-tRNA reductase [Mucilaginibacter frigoritolerans]